MRLLISAVTAKKVVSLDRKVYDDDDLSSGLHPFSVGYVSVEEANQQSRANHISNMIYSGDAMHNPPQWLWWRSSSASPHACGARRDLALMMMILLLNR